MEYLTNGKRRIRRKCNVKRGRMYNPLYDKKEFETIPVVLVDWHGEIPVNVEIESEEELEISIPLEEAVRLYDEMMNLEEDVQKQEEMVTSN